MDFYLLRTKQFKPKQHNTTQANTNKQQHEANRQTNKTNKQTDKPQNKQHF